jgi:hypothetical protein
MAKPTLPFHVFYTERWRALQKMNRYFQIILLLTLFSVSCTEKQKGSDNQYYVENKLSFFNPYEISYEDGKYVGETYKKWIREPENLIMVHETFKKIGYKKLFSRFDHSNWCGFSLDVSRPTSELIDSLIITYETDSISSKYFKEFWNRRKAEQNDSTVFGILKEVSSIVYNDKKVHINNSIVNDTLYNLINIREFEDSIDEEKAEENFNYLKSIGLHNSAYNLLYERYRYYDIKWNKEELEKKLNKDTINCCPWAFIEDDTK